MRKSTWIMLGILFAGMCGLLFAANAMLQPLARDAELSATLTRFLLSRGDLPEGGRVTAVRAPAGGKRLATEGRGLILELEPARSVLERSGGLASLARVLARAAIEETGTSRLHWVELKLRLPGDPTPEPLRALLAVDAEGHVGEPTPALPLRVPGPGTAGPAGPGTAAPAVPAAPGAPAAPAR